MPLPSRISDEFALPNRSSVRPRALYIALSPERTDIADELDSAMSRLKLRDPDFATLLYDRYFGINTDQDPVFTEDEYAYLASAPTLRVAYDSYRAPLSYTDPETGAFAGAVALLFEDIAQITGLKFEFVAADCHDEAVRLVERGDADIVYDVDRESDPQAIKSLDTTGPYLRDPMALVAGPNPSRFARRAAKRLLARREHGVLFVRRIRHRVLRHPERLLRCSA